MPKDFFTPFFNGFADHKDKFTFETEELIPSVVQSLFQNSFRGKTSFDATVVASSKITLNLAPQGGRTDEQALKFRICRLRPKETIGKALTEPCAFNSAATNGTDSGGMYHGISFMHPVALSDSDIQGGNSNEQPAPGDKVTCFYSGQGPQDWGKMRGLRFRNTRIGANAAYLERVCPIRDEARKTGIADNMNMNFLGGMAGGAYGSTVMPPAAVKKMDYTPSLKENIPYTVSTVRNKDPGPVVQLTTAEAGPDYNGPLANNPTELATMGDAIKPYHIIGNEGDDKLDSSRQGVSYAMHPSRTIISSLYGKTRTINGKKSKGGHHGVDIANRHIGEPIYTALAGEVILSSLKGYPSTPNLWIKSKALRKDGKIVDVIQVFKHHGAVYVKVGDKVRKGQHVCDQASLGYSFGPHLHYELIYDEAKKPRLAKKVNPNYILGFWQLDRASNHKNRVEKEGITIGYPKEFGGMGMDVFDVPGNPTETTGDVTSNPGPSGADPAPLVS